MLVFQKVTLDDIEKIRPYFLYSVSRICDVTVGGILLWRDYFSFEYAVYNNTIVYKVTFRNCDGLTAFMLPLGEDVLGCIEALECYCSSNDLPIVFCAITKENLPFLRMLYCDTRLQQNSSWSDYLYNASDLINLSGRKYHGQKNHINFFKKTYSNYSFEEISMDNVAEVRDFFLSPDMAPAKNSDVLAEEHIKVLEVLDNFDRYGLLGGLIRVDGKVAAFSLGEICKDVLFVHVEKANTAYKGIYPLMSNEFAGHYVTDTVNFINREEDDGDPGLRISKQSYHPVELIDKYIVEVV